ncbi:oxygen-independent coproporphyrinogen-3 oxidase [Geosporobacter subterraneus DSM 17957]|uniref:Heme chaperone HemW n=1 Tax=Geosporobacter subterraneus DSM 17957 TaxID=1121919 RepID=A0A1M6JHD3_9FIRM|nr:oxygen-independent coproporphyrinogen-3 oxidase [Geosporobacter subterraneus DSM 17957]
MKEIGMYIHIPFCKQKCAYCDFPSFEGREAELDDYVAALLVELKEWYIPLKDYQIKSVFLGGGTPSLLSISQLNAILEGIYRWFSLKSAAEISIEANPGTLDRVKLEYYHHHGINRLSIGLQAWQNQLLKVLGRIHTQQEFIDNYYAARAAGFKNISVDLMFGLPDQTFEDWKETLHQVLQLKPDHVSAYSLKIEEGTPFDRLYGQGKLILPEEDLERDMYHYALDLLEQHKYRHYEISNFALADKESTHNKIYWNNEEYIGLGVGAHSFLNKVRFSNVVDIRQYNERLQRQKSPVVERHQISVEEEISETIFLGLRMMEGIDRNQFLRRFQVDPMVKYKNQILEFTGQGLLVINGDRLCLTKKGIDVSNRVFASFLPE